MINFAYKINNKLTEYLEYGVSLKTGHLISLAVYLPKYLGLEQRNIDDTWSVIGKQDDNCIPVFIGNNCFLTQENTLTRHTIKKVEQVIYNALNNIVNIKCEKLGWFRKKYIITYNEKTIIKKGKFNLHETLEEIIKTDFKDWYSGLLCN